MRIPSVPGSAIHSTARTRKRQWVAKFQNPVPSRPVLSLQWPCSTFLSNASWLSPGLHMMTSPGSDMCDCRNYKKPFLETNWPNKLSLGFERTYGEAKGTFRGSKANGGEEREGPQESVGGRGFPSTDAGGWQTGRSTEGQYEEV